MKLPKPASFTSPSNINTTQPIAIASMKMKTIKIQFLVFVLLLGAGTSTHAEKLLLRGATIHPIVGQALSPGEILIDGATISAIDRKIDDATAKVVELPKGSH